MKEQRMSYEQAAAAYRHKAKIDEWQTYEPCPEKSGPIDVFWYSLRTANNGLICHVSTCGMQVKTVSGSLPETRRVTRW